MEGFLYMMVLMFVGFFILMLIVVFISNPKGILELLFDYLKRILLKLGWKPKKDGERDSPYKSYYKNGQLEFEINYKDGKRDGPYKMYYENGQLEEEGNFKDNKEEGLWKCYHENGQLESEEYWKDGKRISKTKEQKIVFSCYPNLRGIDFSKVKFGSSGKPNTPEGYFASDIDGDWYFATSQMTMLFKAFSKDKFESGLKLLLDKNSINFGDVLQKNGFKAWEGDGFQIEHTVIEGNNIIIITNENAVPVDSDKLGTTSLAPEVDLPDGYKNIGIEHVYDGDEFLKANHGDFSLNIPLLFKDPEDDLNYIIIGITTLTVAKKIINDIIEKNYGKTSFTRLEDRKNWEYMFQNKFFSIGFMSKNFCVRINMLHNLIDLSKTEVNKK